MDAVRPLGRLHIRLVERIDPETDPVIAMANSQRKNSRPSRTGRRAARVRPAGLALHRDLPGCRHQPLAVLAGRLGAGLLSSEPEPTRVSVDADLVPPLAPALREPHPELEAWARRRAGTTAPSSPRARAARRPRGPRARPEPFRTATGPSTCSLIVGYSPFTTHAKSRSFASSPARCRDR